MRRGAGPGRTRADHLDIAAQVLAALSRSREARQLGELVGTTALSTTDQRYLALEAAFEKELLDQPPDEPRPLDDTLDRAWRVVGRLPRRELTMVPEEELVAHYVPVESS
jgi:V/A-type H+-transporting ATPase subunit B